MPIALSQLKKQVIILCPICNKDYKPNNIKRVAEAGDVLLAHSNCPRCHSNILSLLYKDILGITMVGMVSDLNYDDAVKIKNQPPLDEDDILAAYQQIKQGGGNFQTTANSK